MLGYVKVLRRSSNLDEKNSYNKSEAGCLMRQPFFVCKINHIENNTLNEIFWKKYKNNKP
ncbi:hypothetical protein BED47_05675 [Gottfriedia luciferensis]|uniref:Uncharacterized protein n=1 Tax=Gottfriedia luciferensis TaxID=178774 RepID=A0ABX2ZY33_9BACI|nr:hypothetical protein BED47_05675 [Gottfriedia luciferensis]